MIGIKPGTAQACVGVRAYRPNGMAAMRGLRFRDECACDLGRVKTQRQRPVLLRPEPGVDLNRGSSDHDRA